MGLPYSPSSRVILFLHACSDEQAFFIFNLEFMMVSLKSFLHYFSPARPAQPLSEAEKQQIEALIQAFGGEANITQVDACITRLRVTVRHLAAVDSDALQQQGALGVIILGQQVHAIFGKQSDALRQLLDEHFAAGNK
jgi:PTS system glucose-specific IIB component